MQRSTLGSSTSLGNYIISRAGMVHRSRIAESHALGQFITQELQNLTRRKGPPLRNRGISRREQSTARESENLTRGSVPPLRNRGISRAGRVQHPEIAESYAQEGSIAQESGKPTRGKGPSPRNREIPRAG